jgi:hypothetical protein
VPVRQMATKQTLINLRDKNMTVNFQGAVGS